MERGRKFDQKYDVIVVGARCAGASTAMLLARAGAKVLLVDRQGYGTDRTSTHALMRGGVLLLKNWGLLPALRAADTPAIRRTSFHYGSETIGIAIRPEFDVDYLIAPRRTVLDRILVDAALDAGADVRHGVMVKDVAFAADGRARGVILHAAGDEPVLVRAGTVVGADGRQSTVARRVGASATVSAKSASAYVYGYYDGLAADGYQWYFEKNVAAGIIPTNHGQHCVFAGVPRDRFAETFKPDMEAGFLRVAAQNDPALAATVADAWRVGRLRGFVGVPGYLKRAAGPGWALVGDAGYFKDPLTAHGITDALRDAELLSRALLAGSLGAMRRYEIERDRLSRPLLQVTDEISSFDWDLPAVKAMHMRLNKAMKTETATLASLTSAIRLAA